MAHSAIRRRVSELPAETQLLLPDGKQLTLLFERAGLPEMDLPRALVTAYGGGFGLRAPTLIANFVASLDGVVALPGAVESGHIVSGASQADHFVMGLLRACVDCVMVGAGTFRRAAQHRFDAEAIYPKGALLFATVRQKLGLAPQPQLVIVTRAGAIDATGPAIATALIVTTAAGAAALRPRVPATTRIAALPSTELRLAEVVALLRAEGLSRVLSEGGPSLFAELLAERLVDELFMTSSPALFGRFVDDQRKSLAAGRDLAGVPLELQSLRLHGSYVFSRYKVLPQ
jgi:riboflavin biosynthesis pyrimidine reductase